MHTSRAAYTRVLITLAFSACATFGQITPPSSVANGRFANVSVRAFTGTGSDVLIAGFVLTGHSTRPMLLRAVGPGLAAHGVSNYLIDPELRLFRTANQQVINDSWGDDFDLIEAHQRLGAFELEEASRDAAVLMPLAPGTYTAHAQGRNGTTGDVLLEIYDAATATDEAPAMVNISLRGELGLTNPLLIGGFVITDGPPKRVLLRAIGPSLAQFGVANALGNPRMRLYRDGELMLENDNWAGTGDPAAIEGVFDEAGAFELARTSEDAVLVATLPPGSYTAHIDDPTGGNGIVLTEIYDLEPPSTDAPVLPSPDDGDTLPGISMLALQDAMIEGAAPGATVMLIRSGDLSQAVRVRLSVSGTASADDYTGVPEAIIVPAGSATKTFTVGAWADGTWEPSEVLAITVEPDAFYVVSGTSTAHLVIRDASPLNGTGWQAEYFNNRDLQGTPVLTRTDATINFEWDSSSPDPLVPVDNFSVRWTGAIQVDTTQDYTFVTATDDGVRLWVDDQLIIDGWVNGRTERSGTITLAAGIRYNVRMEYFERTGRTRAFLSWQAAGMPQHVIPINRVFPPDSSAPAITSPTRAFALVGGPFSYTIAASASPLSFSATGLPAGLMFDAAMHTISGTPTVAGAYPIVVTATNAHGTGAEILHLDVRWAGLPARAEHWSVATTGFEPPDDVTPASADLLTLESAAPAGTTLERIRGYITAPKTGNYTFWVSASGPAEFRLADSDQPGDRWPRARVAAATAVRQWSAEAGQQSMPVALEAGGRYYFELLHRPAASGAHAEIGWSKPGEAATAPSESVPAYAVSRFAEWIETDEGKVLYLASLRPESGVASPASGTVSLLFEEATMKATLSMRLSSLSSAQTAAYIYAGEVGVSGPLLQALPNGSFNGFAWEIKDAGNLTAADLASALRDGLLYVIVHTANFPAGELRGQFGAASGSARFTPPPAPPALPTEPPTQYEASRFLTQATFGPTMTEIDRLRQIGYDAWLTEQFATAPSYHLPYVDAEEARLGALDPVQHVSQNQRQDIWWENVLRAPDQLRQRVAFALSEIFVTSDVGGLGGEPIGLTVYYDMLVLNAFGNFRTLLEDVTLSPAMGNYLSMIRNRKPDPARGIYPDENYAREVMQLFSIGLHKLHPDGTLVLDTHGLPIPTYTQETIVGLAHVLTGWAYYSEAATPNYLYGPRDFRRPMMMYESYHATGDKRLLESTVLPGGGTGPSELAVVLDMLFQHPNVGPFICRQLIQRLVTSNPSPGYVYRVAQVFANNGAGGRGDLAAVVRAILLDPEARSIDLASAQGYGKLREPLLRMTQLWRAFNASSTSGLYLYRSPQTALSQAALRSPTVFNFFEPDFVLPGILASAGLVAPEFMITSETTLITLSNQLRTAVFSGVGSNEFRINLDLSQPELMAGNPGQLTEWLNILLMGGTMPLEMRDPMVNAIERIPATSPTERVRTAINVITVSPQYSIQK